MATPRIIFGVFAFVLPSVAWGQVTPPGHAADVGAGGGQLSLDVARWLPLSLTSPSQQAKVPEAETWRHWRSMAEMAAFLGAGAIWYWLDIERNLADWDRLSLDQRFSLDAIRADNNDLIINYVAHSWAGASYYVLARSNQLSVVEASAYSLVTSTLWEYGLEFNERTSYNDALVTPGAGIALGEAWYSVALLLSDRRSSLWDHILGWTIGLPVALNRLFDEQLEVEQAARIRNSRLEGRVYYGLGDLHSAGYRATRHSFGLQTEVIQRQDLRHAQRTWFADGDWTRFSIAGHAGEGVWGAAFDTDAVLAGVRTPLGSVHDAMLGTGLGFEYAAVHLGPWKHQHGLLHLPGLFFRGLLRSSLGELRTFARATPDFSATNALGYSAWRQDNPDERGKSILAKQGYYYGWGWSGRLGLELKADPLTVGADAVYGEVDSLDGLDRSQEELSVDERAFDSRDNLSGYARWTLVRQRWGAPYVELRAERERRRSQIEQRSFRATASEWSLRLGTEFW